MSICHNDLNEPIGQVDVQRVPFDATVRLMGQHDFHEQHVRESITHGLVDDVGEINEVVERCGLRRGGRLIGREFLKGVGGEQNSAVAIGLEVNADVVMFCSVV